MPPEDVRLLERLAFLRLVDGVILFELIQTCAKRGLLGPDRAFDRFSGLFPKDPDLDRKGHKPSDAWQLDYPVHQIPKKRVANQTPEALAPGPRQVLPGGD